MDKIDVIPVKLNEKNYGGWSFHLQNFVEGHGLDGYLDETVLAPLEEKSKATIITTTTVPTATTTEEKFAGTWKQNNAKVVTRILNSIDPSIAISLHSFKKASDMWVHFKKLYHQINKAK